MKRCLMLLALLALAGGCRQNASCRPGTLFITLTFDGATAGADTLHVTLTDSQGALNAETKYQSGSTLQVDFPSGRYLPGESVTLLVIAQKGGVELARVEKDGLVLPKSCAAVKLAFGANDDLGVGDLSTGDGISPADLTGVDLAGADLLPPRFANGAPCMSGPECVSNFCVDGLCCNVACDQQCEACDVDTFGGQCVPVVSGQPHGARPGCAGVDGGAGVCGGTCSPAARNACSYPGPATTCSAQTCVGSTKYLASVCDQAGNCLPAEQRTCPMSCIAGGNDCMGACMSDGDCAANPAGHFCDAGVCTPMKPRGHTCAAASECTSGSCADGVCCNNDCTGSCDACAESGSVGTCVKVVGAVRTASPPPTRAACVGSGACAGSCNGTSDACVNPGNSTGCNSQSCTSGVLTPVGECDGNGGCTQTPSACNTNFCNGTACGPCANDPQCGTGNWCNTSANGGTCQTQVANGGSCIAGQNDQCANGNCASNGICCASACGGSVPACSVAGTGCVCSGSSCGGGNVCLANGTCCTPACNGSACGGSDSCGGTCGCSGATPVCSSGTCICSGSSCGAGVSCYNNHCCHPNCGAMICGSDGCGGSCGAGCPTGKKCCVDLNSCIPNATTCE